MEMMLVLGGFMTIMVTSLVLQYNSYRLIKASIK